MTAQHETSVRATPPVLPMAEASTPDFTNRRVEHSGMIRGRGRVCKLEGFSGRLLAALFRLDDERRAHGVLRVDD